jgi:hypothetical protein
MKTINLLPKSRQSELRYDVTLRSVLMIAGLTVLSYAVVFLLQFGLKFYLKVETESIKKQIAQLQEQVNKQENSDVKAKVKTNNDLVSDYLSLATASPNWARIIKAFSVLPPEGIKVSGMSIDPAKKIINITGSSPTRELVIKLYNNILLDPEEFYGIDYPLENVAQPTNNNFHFTFSVKDSLWQP